MLIFILLGFLRPVPPVLPVVFTIILARKFWPHTARKTFICLITKIMWMENICIATRVISKLRELCFLKK